MEIFFLDLQPFEMREVPVPHPVFYAAYYGICFESFIVYSQFVYLVIKSFWSLLNVYGIESEE